LTRQHHLYSCNLVINDENRTKQEKQKIQPVPPKRHGGNASRSTTIGAATRSRPTSAARKRRSTPPHGFGARGVAGAKNAEDSGDPGDAQGDEERKAAPSARRTAASPITNLPVRHHRRRVPKI
jgi:hypothetical protein